MIPPLTDQQLDRYARHIVLREVGGAGQAALLDSHAVVIGAGGIGCPVLLALAGAGVGTLSIVDDDVVALSNLQRQFLFGVDDVGEPKAEAAARALTRLNPGLTLRPLVRRVSAANVLDTLTGASVVVDGSDNFATRLLVADTAHALRIPLVSAAIGQFQGQVGTWTGWLPDKPCYRCFVGEAFDAEDCDTCADLGVLGAMTAWVGSLAALEVVRVVTGFGEAQAGRVQFLDGLAPAMRAVRMPKDPACPTCGTG